MQRKNLVNYHISVRDETTRVPGVKRARGQTFQESFSLPSSKRPPLRHILDWIDTKAGDIAQAVRRMKANPGTKTLRLFARFPVGKAAMGHYIHQIIPATDVVDGLEIERLKAKVIAAYDGATPKATSSAKRQA